MKRVGWLFVDNIGVESEELQNIVDAKTLTKGLSLVKFRNSQMSLIDNNYDKTNKPVSKLYDEIIVLSDNTLAVKINSKLGVLKLAKVQLPKQILI